MQSCSSVFVSPSTTCLTSSQAWNVLALDGSNWQKIDLFNFQTDIEVRSVLCFMCMLPVRDALCVSRCACWVALSSPRLSAGSVSFGANCDVTDDPLSCGLSYVSLSLFRSVSLFPRGGSWRTFQNAVEVSWGSWASEAAWVSEMPLWSENLIVCLAYTELIRVVQLWLSKSLSCEVVYMTF